LQPPLFDSLNPSDQYIALVRPGSFFAVEAIGLDRSVQRRGLAVMPPATADRLVGTPGVRVLKPIGPRLRGEG
jgi:hypothetical protein